MTSAQWSPKSVGGGGGENGREDERGGIAIIVTASRSGCEANATTAHSTWIVFTTSLCSVGRPLQHSQLRSAGLAGCCVLDAGQHLCADDCSGCDGVTVAFAADKQHTLVRKIANASTKLFARTIIVNSL